MTQTIVAPTPDEIGLMRERIAPFFRRTPVIHAAGARCEFLIKAECLQATGAFKARAAAALLSNLAPSKRAIGVNTASSGNFGIALAAISRQFGAPVTIYIDPAASPFKVEMARRYGAKLREVSSDEWWSIVETHEFADMKGPYLNAVGDAAALAANGTIGIEILEDAPDIDAIILPIGGGGLICGVAAAVKSARPDIRIIACEYEGAAPLSAARAAGAPAGINPKTSFITGVGARFVLKEMWPLLQQYVDECVTVSLAETAHAIRTALLNNHILLEGAGALPIAAVLSGKIVAERPLCVASGGNISRTDIAAILAGGIPD